MAEFNLKHVMLYAKHWYKRSDNIWDDLKKCLTADGFYGEVMTKYDVAYLLLNAYDKLPFYGNERLVTFVEGIAKENCWKHGYYTTDHKWVKLKENEVFPEYDYHESIVRYVLSFMVQIAPDKEGITLCEPDFENVLPPNNHVTKEKVKEMFNK